MAAPVAPALKPRTSTPHDEFWDLVLEDPAWLDAEFDAIVAADNASPPPAPDRRPRPPTAHQRCQAAAPEQGRRKTGRLARGSVSPRQRSPPAAETESRQPSGQPQDPLANRNRPKEGGEQHYRR
jgi:hypothetical protein